MIEQIYLQFKQPSSEFGFASTLTWNGDFSEQAVKQHSELLESANNQKRKVWILFDKSTKQPALCSLVSPKYSLVFTNISIPTKLKAENVRNFLLAQLPFASPIFMQRIADIDANLNGNTSSDSSEGVLGVFLQSDDNPAKPYYNITEHFVKSLSGDLKISAKLVGRNIFCLHYESPSLFPPPPPSPSPHAGREGVGGQRRGGKGGRGERGGGQHQDILSSQGVDALIHQVCEPYASMFKNHFDKTILGFCIEPPDFLSCESDNLNELPWTPEFPNYFSKVKNYSLLEMLPLLFYDSYASASVRHDFWEVLTLRFAEVCIARLRDWASGYGVKLALTQPLIARSLTRNSLLLFAEADIPAVHEPLKSPRPPLIKGEQFSKRLILFKQAVSIAEQFRKPYILFKTSDNPHTEASLVKRVNNLHWGSIAGGNRFANSHQEKPSFSEIASPSARNGSFALRRLSYILSCGKRCCNLLVLNPIGSLWVKFGHQNYHWINSELASISEALIHSHYDFDFGDEYLIAAFGQVNRNSEFGIRNSELNRAKKGKKLIIGDTNYSAVLIPPCINLQGKTIDILRRFASARGKLIAMEPLPYLMDGRSGDYSYPLERLLYSRRTTILRGTREDKLRQLELLLNKIAGDGIEIYAKPENLKARSILKHHRKYGELGICLFLNIDQNKVDALIEVNGKLHVEEWSLESGEKYEPVQWHADNKTYVELQFAPWQVRLLIISN